MVKIWVFAGEIGGVKVNGDLELSHFDRRNPRDAGWTAK